MTKRVQKIQSRARRSMKRRELRGGSKYPSGICRVCRCTYDSPCEGGCAWADSAETLCTTCRDYIQDIEYSIGMLLNEYGTAAVNRLVTEAINAGNASEVPMITFQPLKPTGV